MDWKKLREKYFKECVSSRTVKDSTGTCTDYHQWIQVAPHDLFEWFRKECEGKETPDENSNCIKPDVNQQRELLLAFCDHLNTYAGMEEIRFDFMMQDYLDKSQ